MFVVTRRERTRCDAPAASTAACARFSTWRIFGYSRRRRCRLKAAMLTLMKKRGLSVGSGVRTQNPVGLDTGIRTPATVHGRLQSERDRGPRHRRLRRRRPVRHSTTGPREMRRASRARVLRERQDERDALPHGWALRGSAARDAAEITRLMAGRKLRNVESLPRPKSLQLKILVGQTVPSGIENFLAAKPHRAMSLPAAHRSR